MSSQPASASRRWTAFEQLSLAREVMQTESRTIAQVARRLDQEFCRAVDCLFNCRGSAIVTGIGKAGLIGQKIMATLASTGTRSHFLHPAEAVHGDLGRVHGDDVVLVLSQSGETEEIVRLLPPLAEAGVPIIAITGRAASTLGPRGRGGHRPGARGRGLSAGPGPQQQHGGDAGRGRRLGPGGQPHAGLCPRGFRPLSSGRQSWPETEQGRAAHAAAGAMPRRAAGGNGPPGPGPRERARAADRGHDARRCRRPAGRHLHR